MNGLRNRAMMGRASFWILLVIVFLVMKQIRDEQFKQRLAFRAEDYAGSPSALNLSSNAHEVLFHKYSNYSCKQQPQAKGNSTALVMRTMAPLHPLILDRIYEFAWRVKDSAYDFWLLVDETKNNQTEQLLDLYFRKRGAAGGTTTKNTTTTTTTLQPPRIFSVSETILLQHYPRLTSYIHNHPEQNFHNEAGVCCGYGIMWQMFLPTFALFMQEHQSNYRFAWSFEDDISTHGQHSLYDIVRLFDLELGANPFDLAAVRLPQNKAWGMKRHTMAMEAILQHLRNTSGVEWRRYSDALQRHSTHLSCSIYTEVRHNNVMQFGESFIWPIAWKHNHTVFDLASLGEQKRIFGFEKLTGGKLTKAHGVVGLLNTPNKHDNNNSSNSSNTSSQESISDSTFIFHENIPERSLSIDWDGGSVFTAESPKR